MNVVKKVALLMVLTWLSKFAVASPEADFWRWFQKNEVRLFAVDVRSATMFNELGVELGKVNSDLTFEFGPVMPDGRRQFVVSAGGIKKSFPVVEKLVGAAPQLPRWELIKFRPRRSTLHNIEYGGVEVKVESVRFLLAKDGEKVGVLLLIKGYQKERHSLYGNIGYLYLDEALGEYMVETKLGVIEFQGFDSKHYTQSQPLENLAGQFDEYFGERRY